jgi:hypothetical protein
MTRLRQQAGHRIACRWMEDLRRSGIVLIHYADADVDDRAFRIFRKYDDQELSFPDCVSVALLDRLGIDRIFAFDDDFRRLGYEVVPKAD